MGETKGHSIRSDTGELVEVNLTHLQAIKAFCTECMGWSCNPADTGKTKDGHDKGCVSPHCPLFPYRGKSTAYRGKREPTEAQKVAWKEAGERLRA